ncbi:MAG: ribonuclease III [Phycisphaeraceae bacterium]|nr:ribonuclease III [Phycisphaeraceae bacterium]
MSDFSACLCGYEFNDPQLLAAALTHASSASSRLESYERLEFLGDAVLDFVVSEYLYEACPDAEEGTLTRIRGAVVSRRACAQIARETGLCEHLVLGKGMGGHDNVPRNVAAAVMEAVIAAIYLDGGMDAARDYIMEVTREVIERAIESDHQSNFKSLLQQHVQQTTGRPPQYIVTDEDGPDHAKRFEVAVEIDGARYEGAWARTKKAAEQQAALHALEAIGRVKRDDEGRVTVVEDEDEN